MRRALATAAGRAKGGKGGTSPRRGGIALNESMTVLNGSKGVKKLLRKIDFADVIESGEDADVLFKYLDFDDSGHITVAEFVRGMVETDDLDRHRHRGQQRARRHAQPVDAVAVPIDVAAPVVHLAGVDRSNPPACQIVEGHS